jgi:tetratricopeptide (TPR) repeat protein
VSSLDRLDADRDNLSSALRWLTATGDVDRGLRTATLLWRFWHQRGHFQEGRTLLEGLLTAATPELDSAIHADGLNALGSVAYWQRDNQFAHHCYDQALVLCQEARAAAGIALSQYNLGFTAAAAGDYRSALRRFGAALTEYEALEDQLGASNALAGLALVDRATGAYQRGQQRAAQALTQQRHLRDAFAIANTLSLLGSITTQLGHLTEADAMLREALIMHDQARNASGITWMLRELAVTAAIHGQRQRAVQLSGAAQSLETNSGVVSPSRSSALRRWWTWPGNNSAPSRRSKPGAGARR